MKHITLKVIMTIALALSAGAASAQVQLKVATGTPSGNYSRMFKELQAQCKDQLTQVEVPSKGSIDNLTKLLDNQVNAAITQTDALFHSARNADLSGIKTLFSLYPEEVHVITTSVGKIMEGGTLGFGATPMRLSSVSDLTGRTVAAWGGSVITGQVIRLQSEINFKLVEVADFKAARAALDAGQVAAIIMVGGQPMADVAALGTGYKLVPFSEAIVGKLKSVYVPAKLNYPTMGQGGTGITSVATEALLVTRAYKTEKYTKALYELRKCLNDNVDTLSETVGMHNKWSSVKTDNRGKWSYFEIQSTK